MDATQEYIDRQKAELQRLRDIARDQGEFIQKIKRDIREFLGHPSLGR